MLLSFKMHKLNMNTMLGQKFSLSNFERRFVLMLYFVAFITIGTLRANALFEGIGITHNTG